MCPWRDVPGFEATSTSVFLLRIPEWKSQFSHTWTERHISARSFYRIFGGMATIKVTVSQLCLANHFYTNSKWWACVCECVCVRVCVCVSEGFQALYISDPHGKEKGLLSLPQFTLRHRRRCWWCRRLLQCRRGISTHRIHSYYGAVIVKVIIHTSQQQLLISLLNCIVFFFYRQMDFALHISI